MQQEIINLNSVINPERPFIAVVAGAKYDTKIKPLYAIYDKVDKLILGGVLYNTFLCAKYGINIAGVSGETLRQQKTLSKRTKESEDCRSFHILSSQIRLKAGLKESTGQYQSKISSRAIDITISLT